MIATKKSIPMAGEASLKSNLEFYEFIWKKNLVDIQHFLR